METAHDRPRVDEISPYSVEASFAASPFPDGVMRLAQAVECYLEEVLSKGQELFQQVLMKKVSVGGQPPRELNPCLRAAPVRIGCKAQYDVLGNEGLATEPAEREIG